MDKHCLHIESLNIRRGARSLVKGLSATCDQGQWWGIVGANGAGKTSLLLTLAGLLDVNNKEDTSVLVDGVPLQSMSAKQRALNIALQTQQSPFLMPMPVDVALDCVRSYSARRDINLDSFLLAPLKGKCVTQLSGGEQQRLALAMMALQDAPIMLFDEPLAHLDLAQQKNILSWMQGLSSHSIVSVLHDINVAARYCSHLMMLQPDGSVICGKSEDALTHKNLEATFGASFRKLQDDDRAYWLLED